jgi:hypothetical protein
LRLRWFALGGAVLVLAACASPIPSANLDIQSAARDASTSEVEFVGPVDAMSSDAWTIGGVAVCDEVRAEIRVDPAGKWWIERVHRLAGPTATATLTPTLSVPTPSPTPTPSPMPPGPSATVRPSEEEPSESEATTTPEASDDNGEGEGESEGQSGEEREFTGVVEAIGSSQWTVDARTVEIDGDTEIHGEPHIGDQGQGPGAPAIGRVVAGQGNPEGRGARLTATG